MKTIYLDLPMGAAGDMLSAALFELLDENQKKEFLNEINGAEIPKVSVSIEPSIKCGITGTHFKVVVDGQEEESHDHHHEHEHHHDNEHDHHHHHSSLSDIENIINSLKIPDSVKTDIIEVYELIAAAESHAHGKPVTDIHFHEVGTMDAVADITAVCLLIKKIGAQEIFLL